MRAWLILALVMVASIAHAQTNTPTNTPTQTPTPTCAAPGQPCVLNADCCSGNCVVTLCAAATFTPIPTNTRTPTRTSTPTATRVPRFDEQAVESTATPVDTPTETATATATRTITNTATVTPTATATRTPDDCCECPGSCQAAVGGVCPTPCILHANAVCGPRATPTTAGTVPATSTPTITGTPTTTATPTPTPNPEVCYGALWDSGTGPSPPQCASVVDDALIGDTAWSTLNPTCGGCSGLTGLAGFSMSVPEYTTHYALETQWNAAIPAGATILGVRFIVSVGSSTGLHGGQVNDNSVRLHLPTGWGVQNKSKVGNYCVSGSNNGCQNNTYGNFQDLWGETLTQSVVTDPQFGLAFSMHASTTVPSDIPLAYLGCSRMLVCYEAPTPTPTP